MIMCTTRFDIKSEELAFIDKYLSTQEIHARKEEQEAQKKKEEVFDLISDKEEDEEENYINTISKPVQLVGESILGKRPRITATEATLPSTQTSVMQPEDEDGKDEDDIPLPENSST